MDDGARLWLVKTARKHFWRVSSPWYDFDDLIQDGNFAYYYVVQNYPRAQTPSHRMALFKLVFNSVLCDLANQRTRRPSEIQYSSLGGRDPDKSADELASAFLETVAAEPDIAEALPLFTDAPEYVKRALALYASEEGLLRLKSKYRNVRVGKHLKRETLNERLCRLTGYDPTSTNIVGGLMACLKGA